MNLINIKYNNNKDLVQITTKNGRFINQTEKNTLKQRSIFNIIGNGQDG